MKVEKNQILTPDVVEAGDCYVIPISIGIIGIGYFVASPYTITDVKKNGFSYKHKSSDVVGFQRFKDPYNGILVKKTPKCIRFYTDNHNKDFIDIVENNINMILKGKEIKF